VFDNLFYEMDVGACRSAIFPLFKPIKCRTAGSNGVTDVSGSYQAGRIDREKNVNFF
jgi:hypothetical protein